MAHFQIKNLTFAYPTAKEKKTLDGVNLNVEKGEYIVLCGASGSGKTTLMNMLSGIYCPDAGEIYLDGKPVAIRSPQDAHHLGIGMIHQHFKLVDVFTAAENVALGNGTGKLYNVGEVAEKVSVTDVVCSKCKASFAFGVSGML